MKTIITCGFRLIAIFPVLIILSCADFDPSAVTIYSNIKPIQPMPAGLVSDLKLGGVDNLNPILKWKPKENVKSYEVSVWKSAYMANSGVSGAKNLGERVFYANGVKTNSIQITPALMPNEVYYWSVRGTGEAQWSTFSQVGLKTSQNNYFWFSTLDPFWSLKSLEPDPAIRANKQ